MRFPGMKPFIAAAVLTTLLVVAGIAGSDNQPTTAEVESAKTTTTLLHNELFAALLKEFDETTPANANEGKRAISIIFNNSNRDIRLIGVVPPLLGGLNNFPSDSFEWRSLQLALQGGQPNNAVERIGDRWYYRRSAPLSNTFHANCVTCHASFKNLQNEGQWVGALVTRVPID